MSARDPATIHEAMAAAVVGAARAFFGPGGRGGGRRSQVERTAIAAAVGVRQGLPLASLGAALGVRRASDVFASAARIERRAEGDGELAGDLEGIGALLAFNVRAAAAAALFGCELPASRGPSSPSECEAFVRGAPRLLPACGEKAEGAA